MSTPAKKIRDHIRAVQDPNVLRLDTAMLEHAKRDDHREMRRARYAADLARSFRAGMLAAIKLVPSTVSFWGESDDLVYAHPRHRDIPTVTKNRDEHGNGRIVHRESSDTEHHAFERVVFFVLFPSRDVVRLRYEPGWMPVHVRPSGELDAEREEYDHHTRLHLTGEIHHIRMFRFRRMLP